MIRISKGFTNILASPPSKIRECPKIEVYGGANKTEGIYLGGVDVASMVDVYVGRRTYRN